MKLRYLNLTIDRFNEQYYSDEKRFAYHFTSNCRFIANYLSKAIRKYKIENSIGITMLSVTLTPDENHIKINEGDCVLKVFLHFTKKDMERLLLLKRYEERFDAYLALYERGYEYARMQGYEIGQDTLMSLHHDFRENDYKNEWLWKKKLFREFDLYVFLQCAFTTIDFTLSIEVLNAKKNVVKLKKTLLRTYPDEICYDKDFRHIIINENQIIITDFLDHPFLSINIDKLRNGILSVDDYGHDLLHKYDDEIKLIEW